LDPLLPEFEEATGIDITIAGVPLGNHLSEFNLELASGGGKYDLLVTTTQNLPSVTEYLDPINAYIDDPRFPDPEVDDIPEPILKQCFVDDNLYGFPGALNLGTLFYNRDIFAEYGITEPPVTFEEFMEVGRKLHNPPDLYAYANAASGDPQDINMWYSLFISYRGQWYDENYDFGFSSPEGIRAVSEVVEALEIQPEAVHSLSEFDTLGLMLQGQCAMNTGWAGWLPYFEMPDFSNIIGKAAMGPPIGGVAPMSDWVWVIPSYLSQDKKDMSYLFMDWMINGETDKKFAINSANVPHKVSTYKDPEVLAKYPELESILDTIYSAVAFPLIPEWTEVGTFVNSFIQKATSGEMTPEEAMVALDAEVHDIMVRAGYISE
jgi:multiple sugar transport system substrate-binding protein